METERLKLGQETEAIAAGGDLAPLLAGVRARDRSRADVAGELATLDHVASSETELGQLHDHLQAHLADWQSLLRAAPVPGGRQILRKLLVGRLTFTPRTDGTERYYELVCSPVELDTDGAILLRQEGGAPWAILHGSQTVGGSSRSSSSEGSSSNS